MKEFGQYMPLETQQPVNQLAIPTSFASTCANHDGNPLDASASTNKKREHASVTFPNAPAKKRRANASAPKLTSYVWEVLSASTHVTIHTIFHQLFEILIEQNHSAMNLNTILANIGLEMKKKYEKYWGQVEHINQLLYFGVILDSRYKLTYVDWSFKDMYPKDTDLDKDINDDFEVSETVIAGSLLLLFLLEGHFETSQELFHQIKSSFSTFATIMDSHANTHFHDYDDNHHHSSSVNGLHFDTNSGDCNTWCGDGGGNDRGNGVCKTDGKISCLVDLQRRGECHKVEGGLMALLRNCLESEAENSRSILSGYVDHFQSIVSEDVGWGCGWRNIQMLSSHLLAQRPEAREVMFGGSRFVPDIPSLQRWLEIAWERGFDAPGSDQFNHAIYGSKKWIGTTECAALLRSFGLRARVVDFGPKESEALYLSVPGSSVGAQDLLSTNDGRKRKTPNIYGPMDRYVSRGVSQTSCGQDTSCSSLIQFHDAVDKESCGDKVVSAAKLNEGHQVLMDFVWNYFSNRSTTQFGHGRVLISSKTPLYFQHDGHSRTIVGIQVKHQRTGIPQYNLLILDPAHRTVAIERSLREKVGWQKLIKRGVHTLKKQQYQLCYVDPGVASEEEMEKLKTIDSVFLEF
ncbi:uncharacterized protein LOC113874399 [Abrus precatorius]|uniref:Uncharacterized protein LOC113874399 n=1 Tax=Abrus precatorius TaxID=3816 RepID=A0A8B8MMG0_ABRPR|nr:uncharacterized protein LOC113874399 [Abrus precatorius]